MKPSAASPKSAFMPQVLPFFTSRYTLRHAAEGDCVAYFPEDNPARKEIYTTFYQDLKDFSFRPQLRIAHTIDRCPHI